MTNLIFLAIGGLAVWVWWKRPEWYANAWAKFKSWFSGPQVLD